MDAQLKKSLPRPLQKDAKEKNEDRTGGLESKQIETNKARKEKGQHLKKGKADKKQALELKGEASVKQGQQKVDAIGTNQSQTTSILEMQNKLKEVVSPSSSKPEEDDDYYLENEDDALYHLNDQSRSDDVSAASIPMAHREYEKILR